MRLLDLFAGIGGFSLAASWVGWETVAQVEWDAWCQKVLAKNFPNALRFGDIVEFNKMLENGKITTDSTSNGCQVDQDEEQELASNNRQERNEKVICKGSDLGCSVGRYGFDEAGGDRRITLGHIDIITGGSPCQPFSHAGKRKGTDDSRYLWPAMLETIRRVKPPYVVGENVAGLVSMENGKTLDRILFDLEDEGYTTEQVIIPACAVGAWHRRDRIWIIAHFNNQGLQRWTKTGDAGGGRTERNKQPERCGECNGGTYWQSEPSVGGMVNGLPSFMDGYWDGEPKGVPRVATGIKDRVNRLKGLGNAIVPQIAYILFQAIDELNNI